MMRNLVLIGFMIFSLFGFLNGVKLMVSNPKNIVLGLISLVVANLLFFLVVKQRGEVVVRRGSIIDRLARGSYLKWASLFGLWILSVGNFVYAYSYSTSGVPGKGIEFIEGVVLALFAFAILRGGLKNELDG